MRSPFRFFLGLAAAGLALAACDSPSDSGKAGPPARLEIVSGDLQPSAVVGAELPQPLVVRVLDDKGKPVEGQIVNFRVTAGGGSVFAGAAETNDDGEARERWTLGTVAGDTQRVEARAVDPATGAALVFATFRAVGVPAAPQTVTPVAGNGQSAAELTALSDSLAVRVTDAYGNGVPGASVAWEVTAGGGTVSPAASVTGPNGVARAAWTMGPWGAPNHARAVVAGLAPAAFDAYVLAPPFELTLASPLRGQVSLDGTYEVEAVCNRRCDRIQLFVNGSTLKAEVTGRDTLRATLDAGVDGATAKVVASRRDHLSPLELSRTVLVETTAPWVPVVSAGHQLWDFGASRVLYTVNRSSIDPFGPFWLELADRGTGAVLWQTSAGFPGPRVEAAQLHVRGALAQMGLTSRFDPVVLLDGCDGATVQVGLSVLLAPVTENGRWATHATYNTNVGFGPPFLRDLDAGTSVQLPGTTASAPAENGDVAYVAPVTGSGDREVFRYRGGASTLVALEPVPVSRPSTDGAGVLYLRTPAGTAQAVLWTPAGGLEDLTPVFPVTSSHAGNLRIMLRNGWAAYPQTAGGTLQLWTRAPDGTRREVVAGNSAVLESVGPNGEVVYRLSNRYYLEASPYTAAPLDIGPTTALLRWKGNTLYAFFGRTAFRVDYGSPAARFNRRR